MQKIPTLFVRNPDDRAHILNEVTPGCEWVVTDPHAIPTRKWDGTCVMLDDNGAWWARREVKPGKKAPDNYVPISTDETTGKTVGWEPIAQSSFAGVHAEALAYRSDALAFRSLALALPSVPPPGTYELIGPKINGNPEDYPGHILIGHGWVPFSERLDFEGAPRDYDGLRDWLTSRPYEGIVWWRDPADPRCDKVKLKRRDFQ